jgi:integrase/recombinase XerD
MEPIHNKVKTVKAPNDNVEALTPQEIKALLSVVDESWFTQYMVKLTF